MDKETESGISIGKDGTENDEQETTDSGNETAKQTGKHEDSTKAAAPVKSEGVGTQNVINGDDRVFEDGHENDDSKEIPSVTTYGDKSEKPDYGMSLLQDSIYFDNDIQVSPELIESLTAGFTEKFLPSLEKNRKTISQIKSSQAVLIETVQQENAKFEECHANKELEETMTKAKLYHSKLLRLRKEMTALYEKSSKLKRRALRLQQQKQKEEMTRAQQMEVEYEKEKMLTARVATSSSPEKKQA